MMKVVGGKLLGVCPNCAKIVRIDKPIIGSVHVCLTSADRARPEYRDFIDWLVKQREKELERA